MQSVGLIIPKYLKSRWEENLCCAYLYSFTASLQLLITWLLICYLLDDADTYKNNTIKRVMFILLKSVHSTSDESWSEQSFFH